MIRNIEMSRSSWVIWVNLRCHQKYVRERQKGVTQRKEGFVKIRQKLE